MPLIRCLQDGETQARRDAIDQFMRCYWPAVYAYLRAAGFSCDEAAARTRAFFADVLLARDLEPAGPAVGRLRSLLLAALQRFAAQPQAPAPVPTAPLGCPMDVDAEERRHPITLGALPRTAFEDRWLIATVEEALSRAENHYRATGKPGHWVLFDSLVLRPAAEGGMHPSLREIATQAGFASSADAAAAVQAVRKRVLGQLQELAAATSAGPEEAEAEYWSLLRAFA